MIKSYETELAGRKLIIEKVRIAELANGSVMDKSSNCHKEIKFKKNCDLNCCNNLIVKDSDIYEAECVPAMWSISIPPATAPCLFANSI